MSMVVKNNMSAISTLNTLNKNSSALSKSLAKVSSGMKINSAADDASGYAISERMRVQIRGLDQANSNKAVVEALDGLPTHKIHCSVLAEEAVKAAVKNYYDKNGIEYDKEKFAQVHDCEHCAD